MTPSLFNRLKSVDTPTVCNAIEVAQGKRGFDQFTRGTMLCSAPDEPAMIGYARTNFTSLKNSGSLFVLLRNLSRHTLLELLLNQFSVQSLAND